MQSPEHLWGISIPEPAPKHGGSVAGVHRWQLCSPFPSQKQSDAARPPNATGVLSKPSVICNQFCGFTLSCGSKNIIVTAGRKCCRHGMTAWAALTAGLSLSAAHSQHGLRLFHVTQRCRMPALPTTAPAPRDARLGAGAGGAGPFPAAKIRPVLHKRSIQRH